MKTSFCDKIKEVFSKVKIVENLARQKFIISFLLGLIKSRKVQFCEVAQHLNEEVQDICNEVRIQDFFRQVELDYEQVALLLCLFLKRKEKVRLCIDRTEWDFGKCQVNILMVLACQGAVQVPLYWELLDNKSGNSSTADRKQLLAKCMALLGKERIGIVIADREFVGHTWLKYLKDNGIAFSSAPAQAPPHGAAGRARAAGPRASPRAGVVLKRLSGGWRMGASVPETFIRWRFTLPVWQYGSQASGAGLSPQVDD